MSIAQNIRKYREWQSISLDQFAKQTGLTINDCIQIEAGMRPLTSSEITVICNVLHITSDDLIGNAQPVAEEGGSVVMPMSELQNLLNSMKE